MHIFKGSAPSTLALNAALLGAWFVALPGHAAPVTLVEDGGYFEGWSFSHIDVPTSLPAYNCSLSGVLDTDTVLTGTLGDSNFTITADGTVSNWVTCPWNPGVQAPPGNGMPATVGASHYGSGNYTVRFDKPLVAGSVLGIIDMDGVEFAYVTFRSCSGATISPAAFDPIVISSLYTAGTLASSAYNAATNTWDFVSTWSGNVPDVTTGVVINSPNVCEVYISGPTVARQGAGGNFFYFASPIRPAAAVNATPVPGLGFGALLSLTALLGGLGLVNRRIFIK